jgi:hypothetical protein
MKFHIEVEVEARTPEGWDTPADAEDTLARYLADCADADYESSGVSFFTTHVTGKVIEP